jgi:hypothetical protein
LLKLFEKGELPILKEKYTGSICFIISWINYFFSEHSKNYTIYIVSWYKSSTKTSNIGIKNMEKKMANLWNSVQEMDNINPYPANVGYMVSY